MIKNFFKLQKAVLNLFEGGAAGAAGAGAAGADGSAGASTGETTNASAAGKRAKGEYANVVFGKQEANAEDAAEAGNSGDANHATSTKEERAKAFEDLINGEYKDQFTERTQQIINRRFSEMKNLEKQVNDQSGIIELLSQKYKVDPGKLSELQAAIENDDAYWEQAADEAGMTTDQFKKFQQLQRENAKLIAKANAEQQERDKQVKVDQWQAEAEALKAKYPDFDLNTELQNEQFGEMLAKGMPMEFIYQGIHFNDLTNHVANVTKAVTEKRTVDSIRAKGSRPIENGTTSQSAFTVKDDVSKLSKKDRAEIARRAARGERISF